MKACFLIAERRLYPAKLRHLFVLIKKILDFFSFSPYNFSRNWKIRSIIDCKYRFKILTLNI